MPDFLLIGAKRGGTTSAYFHLLSHPDVLPLFPSAKMTPKARDTKGTHYFSSEFDMGSLWYASHFPSRARRGWHHARFGVRPIAGEASPYYLAHPAAAARAAAAVPAATILVALRDPIERAYSAWREQTRNGVETLSFEDAVAAEPDRVGRDAEHLANDADAYSFAHEFQTYVGQSRYAESLSRWLECYPPSQVHVWASEEYYADPVQTMEGVCKMLGLTPGLLAERGARLNAAPASEMAAATRSRLREAFAEDVAATWTLLGREMPWPNFS
jgi:hypothetical protein